MLIVLGTGCGRVSQRTDLQYQALSPGVDYVQERIAKEPWSIHVVRIERNRRDLSVETLPAAGQPIGLIPLSQQIRALPASKGDPVAAINGDFYQRDGEYAGDPRGLQVRDGELVSHATGGVAAWVRGDGSLQAAPVTSRITLTWPSGQKVPVVLNADRTPDTWVVYSPAAGTSTRAPRGREWVLESVGTSPHLLPPGQTNGFRVREERSEGNTPLRPGTLVLSADAALAAKLPTLRPGDTVQLATDSEPSLGGVRSAIGGGSILVSKGRPVKIQAPSEESYEFSSMMERHPRSAIGWNDQHLFLVTVDGRQEALSVGMTLDELATYMARLGAVDAINLDGGGSATLWCEGKVRNSPCDLEERPVANGLLIVRKRAAP